MDAWAQIRHLSSEGKTSKREIARQVGVSRGTVERALAADRPPRYERSPAGSSFDVFSPRVKALLVTTPTMPASVLAERVGWSGSASLFRAKVAQLRPDYLPSDPADRLNHEPGAQVQCDLWFQHDPLPLGSGQTGMPPVLVMTSSFSGFIQARMLPSRTTSDLLGGMWSLLSDAKAIPGRLLWDNETGIGRGKLTVQAAAFAGTLGTQIRLLPPRDPESKGIVERTNRYFRESFMPGRQFASPQDFNIQMESWLVKANTRWLRSRRQRPSELIGLDRQQMRPLPPVDPATEFINSVRLPRDYYVCVLSNDYSVDPSMIGRIVDVKADLEKVTVCHNGILVASHERSSAKHLTLTDPEHVAKAAVLRKQFQRAKTGPPVVDSVEVRPLASYDQLFGVDLEQTARPIGAGI